MKFSPVYNFWIMSKRGNWWHATRRDPGPIPTITTAACGRRLKADPAIKVRTDDQPPGWAWRCADCSRALGLTYYP